MEYWLDISAYCRQKYGRKLYKVPLDAHFTCPNRDGKLGTRGCVFCAGGSGDFALDYTGQALHYEDLGVYARNGKEGDYLGYFQAYTNTYGPVERCRRLYTGILDNPLFAGISIATRPDCISPEILSLLCELKQDYPDKIFWVELGLQTIHEDSARFIRRGYSLEVFDKAVRQLSEAGMEVIVHVILGIPTESLQDVLQTIHYLNALPVQGVKLQVLQYLKGTDLGEKSDQYAALSFEEYVDWVSSCILALRKDIVIHRITGDADKDLLIKPVWAKDKKKVINAIRHEVAIKYRQKEQKVWDQ